MTDEEKQELKGLVNRVSYYNAGEGLQYRKETKYRVEAQAALKEFCRQFDKEVVSEAISEIECRLVSDTDLFD